MPALPTPPRTSTIQAAVAGNATGKLSLSTRRSTQTIQTAAILIDSLAEDICKDNKALRRSLPDVAAEALQLCSRSNGDAGAVERTLSRDPFISAQVISIANSALFAPRMPIFGVRDAVVRIGFDALRDVVLMVVTNSTMFRVPGFERQVETMRRRMLASAAAARLLAKVLRVDSEYGFLAGLLHDIGELVLLERCVQEGIVVPGLFEDRNAGPPIRDRITRHHTSVGGALCRAWRLPAGVIEAAEFHHDYKPDGNEHLTAHLVAAADAIAALATTDAAANPLNVPAVVDLNLPPDQIAALTTQVKAELPGLFSTGSASNGGP